MQHLVSYLSFSLLLTYLSKAVRVYYELYLVSSNGREKDLEAKVRESLSFSTLCRLLGPGVTWIEKNNRRPPTDLRHKPASASPAVCCGTSPEGGRSSARE